MEQGCIFVHYSLATSMTNGVQVFTGLLSISRRFHQTLFNLGLIVGLRKSSASKKVRRFEPILPGRVTRPK